MSQQRTRDVESSGNADSDARFGRRSILKSALGVGGSSTLAGCFGDGDGAASPTSNTSPSDSGTPSLTASATQSATATDVQAAGPGDNSVIVPPGEDINEAFTEVSGDSQGWSNGEYGVVRLQSSATYEIDETIMMPGGTVLDFNGARMEPVANVDVINMSSSSYLKRPFIDARGQDDWNSNIIKVTTRVNKVSSTMPAIIEQMLILTPAEQGTGVKITDTNGEGLWWTHMTGDIQKADVGIHIRAEGDGSWVNTCRFDGVMRGHNTAILMDKTDDATATNGHIMNVVFQPSDTEWFWDNQTGGINSIAAGIWDTQHVTDGTFWRIGADAEFNNHLIDLFGSHSWEDNVVENKIGDGPNGAAGNALVNLAQAHSQLDLKRKVDDLESRLADLEGA